MIVVSYLEDETIIVLLGIFTVWQILSQLLTNRWKAVWLYQTLFIIDKFRLRIMQNYPLVELFPFWIQRGIVFNVLRGLSFFFCFSLVMWRIRARNPGRWDSLWLDFLNECLACRWIVQSLFNRRFQPKNEISECLFTFSFALYFWIKSVAI